VTAAVGKLRPPRQLPKKAQELIADQFAILLYKARSDSTAHVISSHVIFRHVMIRHTLRGFHAKVRALHAKREAFTRDEELIL